MTIDHKVLLQKYIRHISDCEGANYLAAWSVPATGSDVTFTDEEWHELLMLAGYTPEEIKAQFDEAGRRKSTL